MAILKCKMCGGTMGYDSAQDLAVCPYCGSKSTLFAQDKKLYEQFQNQFAALLNQTPPPIPDEGFWVETAREELLREDGETIEINYLAKLRADICTMYTARHSVIYLFEEKHADYAARYLEMSGRLAYPTPDMERELSDYVPKLLTKCRLSDGRIFLAIRKKEGVYPLKMLGTLLDRHAAWVVSRLENLCCLLEYNDMVLNAFTADNLFADPANHQIYLYGGWWFAGYAGEEATGASGDVIPYLEKSKDFLSRSPSFHKAGNRAKTDLESIRLTAAKLLGYPDREALKKDTVLPKPFRQFLLEPPASDAKADFAKWDKTLLKAYGERKFIPLVVTEEEIYGRKLSEN